MSDSNGSSAHVHYQEGGIWGGFREKGDSNIALQNPVVKEKIRHWAGLSVGLIEKESTETSSPRGDKNE